MEMIFIDYKLNDELLNFSINHNVFNAIIGKDRNKIVDIIRLSHNYKGKIIINNKEITKKELNYYKRKINYIPESFDKLYVKDTIYEIMKYEIRRRKIILKNEEKKILDSLKIVGLDYELLNRSINTLSTSEKKIMQLAIALISNPDILIMEEPFQYLDIKNEKRIMMLLQKIKEQYNKTIVFVSENSDIIYKYTSHLIVAKNNKIIVEGNTEDIFQRVDFLKRNKINIPEIVEFTYLAKKKKQVKIDYHKDIRDIIKDIYKHV